jgi:CubicO group peptidase (beta-lactamase class C family)
MFSRRACAFTLILAVCVVFLFMMYLNTTQTRSEENTLPTYWPTEGWRSETPGKLDLDSLKLVAMVDQIKMSIPTIDSVLVIRHGYVAVEEYFGTFNATTKHHIYSCTKSVVSTLIGVALDRGEIASVDLGVLDLLTQYQPENINDWKKKLTLKNLLMMSSGLDSRDDYTDNWIWLDRLVNAEDAVKYSLDLNVTVQPGTVFKYTDANSHLLSAILIEKTGMATLAYAKKNLFDPLGIHDVMWRNDTSGRQWGFYGLYMTPRDMAKIGYLYLHEGSWDGRMIVSEEWVREATSKKIGADIFPGYGYHWWVNESGGYYTAMGYAGQFIYVFPEKDLVVVFTGHGEENFENPRRLVSEFILPAVK